MSQDQHIQIRISPEDKEVVRDIFENMGLSFSGAIKLFLRKTIKEQKIPFAITADLNSAPKLKKTVVKKTQKIETAPAWTGFQKHTIG